jgi:mannan endo-1,4-beta-mannosidase
MNLVLRIGCATVLLAIAGPANRLTGWAGADEPPYTMVDSKATAATRNLYRQLHHQAGHGILFGQQDATAYGVGWSAEPGRSDVKDVCGEHPAVYGWDIGDIHLARNLDGVSFALLKQLIREADARGGINTVSMHLDNPVTGRNAWDNSRAVRSVLAKGESHTPYLKTLDLIAHFLKELKRDDGTQIPIVLRPYHEHSERWPWWGRTNCTEADFIALWRMTVTHLRDTRDVHNLLYAISPQDVVDENDYLDGYPGDEYVDIFGLDYYKIRKADDVNRMGETLSMVARLAERHHKVCALTETGIDRVPISDWWTQRLLPALNHDEWSRKTVWALVWRNKSRGHHFGPYPGHDSADDFVKFYEHPLMGFGKRERND